MLSGTRMLRLATLAAALAAGIAAAEDRKDPQAAVAGIAPGEVDGETARKLVADGVKVVDVRTPAEFAGGHVPGALNIPHDQIAARHGEIGAPSTPVLLYCKSGRRTEIAARALREKGFTVIYDLRSYDRWVASERAR